MKILSQSATEFVISQTRAERAYEDLYWRVSGELARASEWRAKSEMMNSEPMTYGYFDQWKRSQNLLEVHKWS